MISLSLCFAEFLIIMCKYVWRERLSVGVMFYIFFLFLISVRVNYWWEIIPTTLWGTINTRLYFFPSTQQVEVLDQTRKDILNTQLLTVAFSNIPGNYPKMIVNGRWSFEVEQKISHWSVAKPHPLKHRGVAEIPLCGLSTADCLMAASFWHHICCEMTLWENQDYVWKRKFPTKFCLSSEF